MKRIDFEAHFLTEECLEAMKENRGYPRYVKDDKTGDLRMFMYPDTSLKTGEAYVGKLLDIGEERVKAMDAAGVDVHVLSLSAPGVEQFDAATGTALAKSANDELSKAIRKHPDRFLGFAALAPQSPDKATKELERAVKELGFVGWNTHSNYDGTYLDDEQYWPILAKAEELNVPIYLHPTAPAMADVRKYGFALAGAPFGFTFDAALCMMRLILSGVFDKYPKLKIILGHYGEALPFILTRIDWAYLRPADLASRPKLERKPSEYMKDNVFVTTSGNFFEPAFMCTYQALGIERILLGTDFPYEQSDETVQFIEGLPISQEEKEKLYYQNAAQIGISV